MEENMFGNGNEMQAVGRQEYISIEKYTAKTFLWMFLGLMVTFIVSITGYVTNLVYVVFSLPAAPFLLLIAELAVVWFLVGRIEKMSVNSARMLFFVYSILNGIVFSAYFLMFEVPSLVFAFGATALYFGIMAVFGYTTKIDLSKFRYILMGGLVFLVIFWVLSMFLNMAMFDRFICMIGVIIFLGFTAYDTQMICKFHQVYAGNPEMAERASVYSALQLYLDFVNLFLYLLRFFGASKD